MDGFLSQMQNCYIDGLVQERHNCSTLAMDLCISCINPLLWASQKELHMRVRWNDQWQDQLDMLNIKTKYIEPDPYALLENKDVNIQWWSDTSDWNHLEYKKLKDFFFILYILCYDKCSSSWHGLLVVYLALTVSRNITQRFYDYNTLVFNLICTLKRL